MACAVSLSEMEIKEQLVACGQGHAWEHLESLDGGVRVGLLGQLQAIDWNEFREAIRTFREQNVSRSDLAPLTPAPYIQYPQSDEEDVLWEDAKRQGIALLAEGRVAVLTVAGGQGTRLGFSGPKGCFAVTPVRHKSLFQLFAEKIQAAQERYGVTFPWLVMTSHVNDAQTRQFLKEHAFFGLKEDQVMFFEQGRFPAIDFEGKLIFEARGRLAMSPDGHGGAFDALKKSGVLAQLIADGIETLSYFQVDNPLVSVLDPVFVGFHRQRGASMSSKMVIKERSDERVGLFCKRGETLTMAEYSDIPESLAQERDASGALKFRAGNIAVHLIDCSFIERVAQRHALPYHFARKAIPFLNSGGEVESPSEPNGIKFEKFIFDALQFDPRSLILESIRSEEFSPVKNAEGPDSPETSMMDQSCKFGRWMKRSGVDIPCTTEGLPLYRLEVSPLFADDTDTFFEKWAERNPSLNLQGDLYIE